MSLLSLSNEILSEVTQHLHPSSVVDFSLSCQRIYACAAGSLARHRSRIEELRAYHDRHPMNIIKLLRSAIVSPDILWYVRVLEFYGARWTWESWTTYPDFEAVKDEPMVDLASSGSQLLSDLDLELVFQNYDPRGLMKDGIERIKKGDDEPLKALLIAACPQLQKITWAAYDPQGHGQPYSILCELAAAYHPLPQNICPPGLLSLRSISLGACIEHVHPHDNLHPDVQDFCRLLLLPNLKSLRINVVGFGDSDLEYLNTHVPVRSSAVEEFTTYICDFDQETIVAMLQRLRSLKVYRDIFLGGWTNILGDIQPWFSDSLEELRPECGNDWNFRLYGQPLSLSKFSKLRVFEIYVGDVIAGNISDIDEFLSTVRDGKQIEWHDFHDVLPQAAEEIYFCWAPGAYVSQMKEYRLHKTVFPDFFKQLDKFIRKRKNDGYLKTICLDFAERSRLTQCFREREVDGFLSALDKWGKLWGEMGVELFTDVRRRREEEVLECRPSNPEYD